MKRFCCPFIVLIGFILRAQVVWLRETLVFTRGSIFATKFADRCRSSSGSRARMDRGKPAGSWATLILEQIDDMHDYYARYLPQMALAVCVRY